MTAKEYLSRAYRAKQNIAIKERQIAELHIMADGINGIDYSKDRVSASSVGDESLINLLTRIEKLEARLNAEKLKYIMAIEEATEIISKVEFEPARQVLECRYLSNMKWEEIAGQLNYTVRHIYRLHGAGLNEVGNMLPETR